jgi:hypothetical protein
MMVKSAQPGEGSGAHPPPFTLFTITYKLWYIRYSWEGRYTPFIFPLPLYVLCGINWNGNSVFIVYVRSHLEGYRICLIFLWRGHVFCCRLMWFLPLPLTAPSLPCLLVIFLSVAGAAFLTANDERGRIELCKRQQKGECLNHYMRSSLTWIRSSLVVRASECTSCNDPGFDPSIRRHRGIWGAADETVLNIL